MRSFRDIKIQARRDLHSHAQIPALYISPTGKLPFTIPVRLHSKNAKVGALVSDKTTAERFEIVPRIIFMIEDLSDPKTGAIFTIAEGEAYRVEKYEPFDVISVVAICTRLDPKDTIDLPLPNPDITNGDDPGDLSAILDQNADEG